MPLARVGLMGSIGISALEGYRAEYDEEKKVLRNTPLHDHNSHGADGFRTFAVGYKPKRVSKPLSQAGNVRMGSMRVIEREMIGGQIL